MQKSVFLLVLTVFLLLAYNLKAENNVSSAVTESYQGFTADLDTESVIGFTNFLTNGKLDVVTYSFVKEKKHDKYTEYFGTLMKNRDFDTDITDFKMNGLSGNDVLVVYTRSDNSRYFAIYHIKKTKMILRATHEAQTDEICWMYNNRIYSLFVANGEVTLNIYNRKFKLKKEKRFDLARVAAVAYTYIYGYAPIAEMQKAYDQTNPTADSVYAPTNELYISTEIDTPDSELFVSPNVNVLYSSSHMDLTAEPMVLYTPSIQDRYFVWEIMDAYTNAANYIGSRVTGGVEGTYAIVGPNWTGTLPDGYTQITSATNSVWMVGRHEVTPGSQEDFDAAQTLVESSVFLPLSEFITRNPDYVNPIINKPGKTIKELDISGLNFFTLLNEWLTQNPPPAADAEAEQIMTTIGVGVGSTTDFNALSKSEKADFTLGVELGFALIRLQTLTAVTSFNGWGYTLDSNFGNWGIDYLLRAAVARDGLAANVNAEAIYPVRIVGPDYLPLKGSYSYTLTFTADQLPVPVNSNGFWSITMYDRNTGTLVVNSINRYAIGNQNDLILNEDGSLTLYIQRDDPGGEMTNNWLPSPTTDDSFYMLFRMYYPDNEAISPMSNPDWQIPNLERSDI
ncbi:MAG: DUF1254 domain-containing protein [Victivallaceae bacterium]|nr:DUF1254 domain-containing protein [Victivallaceae bacterium]